MWQRFTLYDIRVVSHYLGVLLVIAAGAQLIPFFVSICFAEWSVAARYLFCAGLTLCIGTGMRMMRIEPGQLNRQQAMAVTGFGWMVLGLASAVPLAMSGHFSTYLDALFDCVSGFTCTGVSIISDLDHLSNGDNMWRFIMHFMGGTGLVVIAMSLGIIGGSASTGLYMSEGRSEHVVPSVMETARFIIKFSFLVVFAFTLAFTVVMFYKGMSLDRAFLHSLWVSIGGFMTAGFAPMSASIAYYHSPIIEWMAMAIMLVGGINFSLHGAAWRGRIKGFFQDIETRTAIIWWTVLLASFMFALSQTTLGSNIMSMVRSALFIFISSMTTTGFATLNTNQIHTVFSSGAILILVLGMTIGAGAGSTCGGIKLLRVGIIVKSVWATIKSAFSPDSARVNVAYYHIGRHLLSPGIVKEAMTIFILFTVTYAIGAMAGVAYGYGAIDSIFESVIMASSTGISAGISSQSMPEPLQIIYMLEMWAGRLEFITFLALFFKIIASLKPHKLNLHHIFNR